jgi:hypothetical protein
MNKVYEKHCKGCSSDLTLAEYKALVAKAEQEALKKLDKEILQDDKKSEEK